MARLELTRPQILAFRRRVGALEERLPPGPRSLRTAAWAGLQDSMPRAALLSIHARRRGRDPEIWDDDAFVQVWGPRFSTYVVPAEDHAIFTVGRLPETQVAGTRRGWRSAWSASSPGERCRPRARSRARRPRELLPLRGDDGHGPHPLGWCARAGCLDGSAARPSSRSTRGASSRAATSTSSGRARPRRSRRGRASRRGRGGGFASDGLARCRCDAARRRVAPRERRGASCGSRPSARTAGASAPERRHVLPARRGASGAPRPRP